MLTTSTIKIIILLKIGLARAGGTQNLTQNESWRLLKMARRKDQVFLDKSGRRNGETSMVALLETVVVLRSNVYRRMR